MNNFIKKLLYLPPVLFSLFLLAACDSDDKNINIDTFTATATYQVTLTGTQQVPINSSSQTVIATIEINENDNLVRASMDISNISGFTAAHLHRGKIGKNGDVAFPFLTTSTSVLEIPPSVIGSSGIAAIKRGEWYVNLHTNDFPNGEIRAQIVPNSVIVVSFALSGKQAVPAIATLANGNGYASYDTASTELKMRINTQGVDNATMAHIHTGRIGSNGPVLISLTQGATAGTWEAPLGLTLDSANFAVLASGGHYVNVHTPANPSGEIRGQILTDNYVLASFPLQGSQEVPAVNTEASGSAYALVNTSNFNLELKVVTQGVEDATMAHIHTGTIGMNGSVLVGLEQSTDNANVWMSPADLMIDADSVAILVSGGLYVNVHTPANPSGELRGQILTTNFMLATFPLQGSQEVPAVTSSASGSAYALVDTNTFSIELKVLTEGVEDATMAHIHTGRVGMNGSVLVGLEQSIDDPNIWMSPADLSINAEVLAALASGGHYVNVHTPAEPSGELRGQILTDNFLLATFALQGAQEVPALDTMASGSAYALIDTQLLSVELKLVTDGVMNAVGAHIHTGRIGTNGPVLVGLEQSMDDPNVWMSPENLVIDADTYAVLASGGHYVNVHTPANPGGELRGQILTDNFVLITFPLEGIQEIPVVTTIANGSGYAMVNMMNFEVELKVITQGISVATMAHIHTGPVGSIGPVLVGLVQDSNNPDIWMSPTDLTINTDIFTVLASGGHYVNIHTPANPSGELRGQIQ